MGLVAHPPSFLVEGQASCDGAGVNLADSNRVTPLYFACQSGHEAGAALLAERGANVNLALKDGVTPQYSAWEHGHETCVRLLVQHGADVNHARDGNFTPLYMACWNGHEACVRLLMECGADLNKADNDAMTPLHEACWRGHQSCARLLVEGGADVDRVMASRRCTSHARKAGRRGGADVDTTEVEFSTIPLHMVCARCARLLARPTAPAARPRRLRARLPTKRACGCCWPRMPPEPPSNFRGSRPTQRKPTAQIRSCAT